MSQITFSYQLNIMNIFITILVYIILLLLFYHYYFKYNNVDDGQLIAD